MDIALARPELEGLQRAVCHVITGTMRTTSTKMLEMLLDLQHSEWWWGLQHSWHHTAYQGQIRET